MKAFHTIAVPHKDILEGKLTLNTFAADLWEAFHNRGEVEYRDSELFFRKTYPTEGLIKLIQIIKQRVEGKGGDPVIQIQTPFGGGKTHSLIALMHKAKEWGINCVVIVGTSLEARETLWGLIEKQLTGNINILSGNISPGKEKLKSLLEKYQPAVILIDELLEYIVKASGVSVGETTLAAQTRAFIQELTELVTTLEKVSLVITLPSSTLEHYDENAEGFFNQLQRISGRVERVYSPVNENEISKVIRTRLFNLVDVNKAAKVVKNVVDYFQNENIIPTGIEPTQYRDRFIESFPFLPEVIDILYHRWGSFSNFQRTRGVLRILSLVVYYLKDKNIPYISLADFNLAEQNIRRELLKYIGNEYDSVIAQDITDVGSGANTINLNLGDSYRGLSLATRSATTIFMYSFSGGTEKGATLNEIKRSATTINNPASVIVEVTEQLKSKLYYLQFQNDKFFFSNQPNLNRIVTIKMENIEEDEILSMERELLEKSFGDGKFKVYVWEEDSSKIPDTEDLKLIILKQEKQEVIINMIKNKGDTPRVNCNVLFFLFPDENERGGFNTLIRRLKAYQIINGDATLNITEEQKRNIRREIETLKRNAESYIRRLYKNYAIPTKDGYDKDNLGTPIVGITKKIDSELYERLITSGNIIKKLTPIFISERYLGEKDFIYTKQLVESSYRTPGEKRYSEISVLEEAISEGVKNGVFGLGEYRENQPICIYFKKKPSVGFSSNEIIINKSLCKEQEEKKGDEKDVKESYVQELKEDEQKIDEIRDSKIGIIKHLKISFTVPQGKISDILKMLNYLQTKFQKLKITFEVSEGEINEQDYQNKITETLQQLGISDSEIEKG